MQTKVARWGNSLAVRIPGGLVRDLALAEGTGVSMSLEGGRLILTPMEEPLDIDSLVNAITDDNLHAETDWGDTLGAEQW